MIAGDDNFPTIAKGDVARSNAVPGTACNRFHASVVKSADDGRDFGVNLDDLAAANLNCFNVLSVRADHAAFLS
jgi:hypothetical protein